MDAAAITPSRAGQLPRRARQPPRGGGGKMKLDSRSGGPIMPKEAMMIRHGESLELLLTGLLLR
jgi:hypothetical protein